MSKTRSANVAAPAETPEFTVAPPVPVEQLPLDEFCRRLSEKDRRVELIGAFHFTERAASRTSDTEQQYRARFEAFTKKPV